MLTRISQSFTEHPQHNAFCIEGTHYTYSQLHELVSTIQHEIEVQCSRDEKIIGIITTNDLYTYASILGIWASGRGYLPINPQMPIERNEQIIKQSGISTILTADSQLRDTYAGQAERLIVTSMLAKHAPTQLTFACNPESTAYLLFTSGSTGIPKGVPISFYNLNSFISAFFAVGYTVSCEDRVLQMFDLTFDLSVMSYVVPLCQGACVYTVSQEGMKYMNVASLLEDESITIALMVPSVITFLRKFFDEIQLPALRYSLFCGEALYADVMTEWKSCIPNAEIHNVYGPTEATIFCMTYNAVQSSTIKMDHGIVCIGKAMEGMEAIICDDDGNILENGNVGELCLYGSQLTVGYWGDKATSNKVFFNIENAQGQKTFYRTGDVAYKDKEGDTYYCGRRDNQVKIQGYRVELAEIEFAARDILQDKNAAAVAMKDDAGNDVIFLFAENATEHITGLRAMLQERLPSYMLPTDIYNCAELPLSQNGKIDRKVLKQWVNEELTYGDTTSN